MILPENETFFEDADELLDLFELEEILDMNDVTQRELLARLIEDGLIMTYKDMRNK